MIQTVLETTFKCDHTPACSKSKYIMLLKPDPEEAAARAREAGWYIGTDAHFCPEHAADADALNMTAEKPRTKKSTANR